MQSPSGIESSAEENNTASVLCTGSSNTQQAEAIAVSKEFDANDNDDLFVAQDSTDLGGDEAILAQPTSGNNPEKRRRFAALSSDEEYVSDWGTHYNDKSDGESSDSLISGNSSPSPNMPVTSDKAKAAAKTPVANPLAEKPGQVLAKQPAKRARPDVSDSSQPGKTPAQAKRAKPNAAAQQDATSTAGQTAPAHANSTPSSFMNFSAPTFEIRLGSDGPRMTAHESVLHKSTTLSAEVAKAKTNARKSKQSTITLQPHNKAAFEQMLAYLYTDKLTLAQGPQCKLASNRMKEVREAMSLAKHYNLPAMQHQIVQTLKKGNFHRRMSGKEFFEWAEDVYFAEIDQVAGPFKRWFGAVALEILRKGEEGLQDTLAELVRGGSGYSVALFQVTWKLATLRAAGATATKPEADASAGNIGNVVIKSQDSGDEDPAAATL